MNKLLIAVQLILMALSLACSPAQQESAVPAPSPSAGAGMGTAEVREAADARLKAIAAGDTEAYLSAYTDDAVWMPPGAVEIVGKEAARQRVSQAFEAASLDPVVESREQTVMSPEWIADRGQYSIMVTPKEGGESKQEVGSYLTVWRRDADGKWKIFFDIWNTNRPIVNIGEAR